MSESGNGSGNRNTLIGAAVAVVIAAVGGYQVGFGNGEEGLIEAQKQASEFLETSKTQAAKIEEQTQSSAAQAKDIEAKAAEIAAQTVNIEKLNSDLAQAKSDNDSLAGENGTLSDRITALGGELNDAKAKISELSTQVGALTSQNERYLDTITEGLNNQRFVLTIGGPHKPLVKSSMEVGLSYVSREDKVARVTVGGEQLELELQSPERIRIDGKSCVLNLTNLVSADEAAFEVTCD